MRYLTIVSLLVLILSCNKFEHQPIKNLSTISCELCELAGEIEGHYVGIVPVSSNLPYDSVTFDVEHIFKCLSACFPNRS
jgi:hypothetical protein